MSSASQNDSLEIVIKEVWDALEETCNRYSARDSKILFKGNYEAFKTSFISLYNGIKAEYMKPNVSELDRHKIISTMIIASIENDLVTYSGKNSRLVPLVEFMIPTEVGLNWMLAGLNRELSKRNFKAKISRYHMPQAFACDTPYFEVFCRNLYYANEKEKNLRLNPLDIAEKLFLLEYITLLKNNIDPTLLRN